MLDCSHTDEGGRMIRCGHCQGVHRNVAGVRLCALTEAQMLAEQERERDHAAWMDYMADVELELDCFA